MAAKFYIGGIYQQRGKPFRLLSVHVGERELLYSCRAQRPNSDAADRALGRMRPTLRRRRIGFSPRPSWQRPRLRTSGASDAETFSLPSFWTVSCAPIRNFIFTRLCWGVI